MQNNQEYQRDNYTISTDPARLDIPVIHQFLSTGSYWAQSRPLEVIQRSIENSLNFGVYCDNRQVGFARVVTDYATFGWVCDVFILPEQRKAGLGQMVGRMYCQPPGSQAHPPPAPRHPRRARALPPVWRLYPAWQSRPLDGKDKPLI